MNAPTARPESEIADRVWTDLFDRVLPFWMAHAPHGRRHGLRGAVDEEGRVLHRAPRSTVLAARVAWTFAAVYRHTGHDRALWLAERAASELLDRHLDTRNGGVFWSIDARRRPLVRHKHTYAQAFAIYALTEMWLATGDARWWRASRELLSLVRTHLADGCGGLAECAGEDWRPLPGKCLGRNGDTNARVSTNTLLHVVEALANAVRSDLGDDARDLLHEHVVLMEVHTVRPDGQGMHQWFDHRWQPIGESTVTSPGHDLEAAWLVNEAAGLLDDPELQSRWQSLGAGLVSGALDHGLDPQGGVMRLAGGSLDDPTLAWWAQAEGLAGMCWGAGRGDERALAAARRLWQFIDAHIVSDRVGDWARSIDVDGRRVPGGLAIGPWECPYHVVRTELGVLVRAGRLQTARPIRPSAPPPA